MSKDIAASVRARLLNLAKERKEDFDFILRQFVIQRVLYRLSTSEYADRFLLKGALLFWIWNQEFHRPTIDIDLLGFGSNDVKDLQQLFNTVCAIAAEDGLEFDLSSIKANEIKKDEKYQGVRVTGLAKLTKARIKFQIDIGFGDAVTPGPETAELPSFLDFPDPELQAFLDPVYRSCQTKDFLTKRWSAVDKSWI